MWLEWYASIFGTVEVNATFYRLPAAHAAQNWVERVPAGFSFAIKASRYLTHIKRLREPAEPVARLMSRIAPLYRAGRVGSILVQLPPDFVADPVLLDAALGEFPSDVRIAVEPRHESWFTSQVRDVLERRRAAMVWADRYGKPVTPTWRTTDWCYLRLHHGPEAWSYDMPTLARWAAEVRSVDDGYVYFNNDPGAAAVRDALTFAGLVGRAPGTEDEWRQRSSAKQRATT